MPRRPATRTVLRTTTLRDALLLFFLMINFVHGASAQHVEVPIASYMSFPNSEFAAQGEPTVDYDAATRICAKKGGNVATDQSAVTHNAINGEASKIHGTEPIEFAFLGGNFLYSQLVEPDISKRCTAGLLSPSLNCIYMWNVGRFADPTAPYLGAAFFRGSSFILPNRGPMNGYETFWGVNFPSIGASHVHLLVLNELVDSATWIDNVDKNLPITNPAESYLIICEVQGTKTEQPVTQQPQVPTAGSQPSSPVDASTPPQATSSSSWIKKNWFVPVIIIIGVVAAISLFLFFCGCCCCGKNNANVGTSADFDEENSNPFADYDDAEEEEMPDNDGTVDPYLNPDTEAVDDDDA